MWILYLDDYTMYIVLWGLNERLSERWIVRWSSKSLAISITEPPSHTFFKCNCIKHFVLRIEVDNTKHLKRIITDELKTETQDIFIRV